jgi:cysteinyl-tRNA synthetase
MSKSLKNFITIDDALNTYSARQLRFAFLLQNWAARLDFKESGMQEVRSAEGLLNVRSNPSLPFCRRKTDELSTYRTFSRSSKLSRSRRRRSRLPRTDGITTSRLRRT